MKMFSKIFGIIVLTVLICGSTVDVFSQSDARSIWQKVLRKCARSDKDGKNILNNNQVFLGLGNASKPGTIFRVFRDGSFESSRLFETYTPENRDTLIMINNEFTCTGENESSVNIKPKVGIQAVVPIGGELAVDLKRASKITFAAKSLRWDNVLIGQYEQMLNEFAGAQTARNDLLFIGEGNRDFILTRALRVKGFSAILEFKDQVGSEVKAKFPTQAVSIPIPGQADVGLDLQWTDNTKLVIASNSEFYIAGDIRKFSNGRITSKLSKANTLGLSLEQLFPRRRNN